MGVSKWAGGLTHNIQIHWNMFISDGGVRKWLEAYISSITKI